MAITYIEMTPDTLRVIRDMMKARNDDLIGKRVLTIIAPHSIINTDMLTYEAIERGLNGRTPEPSLASAPVSTPTMKTSVVNTSAVKAPVAKAPAKWPQHAVTDIYERCVFKDIVLNGVPLPPIPGRGARAIIAIGRLARGPGKFVPLAKVLSEVADPCFLHDVVVDKVDRFIIRDGVMRGLTDDGYKIIDQFGEKPWYRKPVAGKRRRLKYWQRVPGPADDRQGEHR